MEPILAPAAEVDKKTGSVYGTNTGTNDAEKIQQHKSARQARNDGSLEYNPVEPMLASADMFCSSP